MIGLAYALEACSQSSDTPLNLIAEPEPRSELEQISERLGDNKVVVKAGASLQRVIDCHLTKAHSSVDLIGHGRGSHIGIGDWGEVTSYGPIGAAMEAKGVRLLRLLACKQAFYRETRKNLREVQREYLTQYRVALAVAGGQVFADQFDRKKRRYDNHMSCNNVIFPSLLQDLFAGSCAPPAPPTSSPDSWTALTEADALALCWEKTGLVIALDADDARRIFACDAWQAISDEKPAFSMLLPSERGMLVGFAYAIANGRYVLVPHQPAGTPRVAFLLNCALNSSLLNKETATLYWR